MENETETKNDPKEQIKALEAKLKTAFKKGNFQMAQEQASQVKALDPENRLAKKLLEKIEKENKKKEAKTKAEKIKEYESMLKKLFKEEKFGQLKDLARELKEFDPENKSGDKWVSKAEKVEAKNAAGPKEGFFASLFKKKEKAEKEAEKPENVFAETEEKDIVKTEIPQEEKAEEAPEVMTEESAPKEEAPTPQVNVFMAEPAAPEAPAVPEQQPMEIKEEAPEKKEAEGGKAEEKKGNIFTRMFKKGEEATTQKSIIDTIVAKTEKKKEIKPVVIKEKKEKVAGPDDGTRFLKFSKMFLNFALLFIIISAAFLYVEFIDQENTVLGAIGIEDNTGSRLHKANETVKEKEREEAVLKKDIELYKGGYNDKDLNVVNTIIDDRLNWPDILAKIKEVTDSVYELNDFFKYIEYDNYSFDAENETVRVSGTLTDPLGRNLTRLVELEEAFIYYPKDKDNPEDDTKPYFQGFKEFTSFSKTLDPQTGKFTSRFQLSFALN